MSGNRPPKASPNQEPSGQGLSQGEKPTSKMLVGMTAESSFSGPLPPPALFEQYEKICPGAAERILSMAEKEGDHRRALENKATDFQIRIHDKERSERKLGQVLGFTIILAALAVATILGEKGSVLAASLIGFGGLTQLVSTFMHGRRADPGAKPEKSTDERQSKN